MNQISPRSFLIFLLLFFIGLQFFFNKSFNFGSNTITAKDCGSWYFKAMDLVAKYPISTTLNADQYSYNDEKRNINRLLKKNNPTFFTDKNVGLFIDADTMDANFNKKIRSDVFFDNLPEVVDWLLNKKKISPQLAARVKFIHLLTIRDASSKIILKYINQLKYADLETGDTKFRDAFVSVYIASYTFWRSKTAEPFEMPSLNCYRALSLAAATGALFGIDKGPEEAITDALVFSSLATINTPCNPVVQLNTL